MPAAPATAVTARTAGGADSSASAEANSTPQMIGRVTTAGAWAEQRAPR